MADNFTKIDQGISWRSLTTDPSNGVEGDVYHNSVSNRLRTYEGAAWKDVTADQSLPEFDNGNSGTSLALSFLNGPAQKVTLTGNCAFTVSNNLKPGSTGVLVLIQDGTGTRTVTWPAAFKWAGGAAPTLSTAASSVDIVSFYYNGTNYYANFGKAFA
jgi:hypothetical protein